MAFTGYYKLANKHRFSVVATWDSLEDAIAGMQERIPENSTTAFQIRKGSKVVWEYKPVTDPRSVEPLVGRNLDILKQKVDRYHVGTSYLDVVKGIKASIRNWQDIPRPLRRGFIQATLRQHLCNRVLYRSVMG